MNVEDTYIPTNLTNFPTNWFYPPFDFSFYSGNTTRNDMVLRSVAIFMMGTRLDSNSSYMHIPRLISTRVSSCLDAASCVEMNLLQNNFDYGWGNESLIPTWNRDTSALPFMTVYDLPFYHLRVKEGLSYLYNPPVRPPKRQPVAFPPHVISGEARASQQKGNRSAPKATVPPSNRQSPFKHTHSPFKCKKIKNICGRVFTCVTRSSSLPPPPLWSKHHDWID